MNFTKLFQKFSTPKHSEIIRVPVMYIKVPVTFGGLLDMYNIMYLMVSDFQLAREQIHIQKQ